MNIGGATQLPCGQIKLVQATHSSSFLEGDQFIYTGMPTGIVHTVEGKTVYHLGDTGLFSDMQLIAEMYRPELAFVPIGDLFTMGPEAAARACRFLEARRVIPIHWQTFPVLTGTPADLEAALAELGGRTEVIALEPGESF